jgi:WD40 repeat protein
MPPRESAKITDFGLAKSLSDQSGLTATESILGSPSYMAPEQAEGHARDAGPAADVYALGAILYELVTGRPPFRGATVFETIEQVKATEPVPPSRLVPKLPRDIETIALQCLQKEPARRYPSAAALADDLRRFLDGLPIVARPAPFWERGIKWAKRRPAIAALVVAVHLLLAGLLVLWAGYSFQLQQSLGDATLARHRAESATRAASQRQTEAERARGEAQGEAYRATLSEVRALRLARPPGWRDDSLKKLEDVVARNSPNRDLIELRSEAVASLGTLDIRAVARFTRAPGGRRPEGGQVAFSPDGTRLAALTANGFLDLWDVSRLRHLRTVVDPTTDFESQAADMIPEPAIAFHPDGRGLVYGTWDRRVVSLDPRGSGPPGTVLKGRFPVRALAFDRRGTRMAVGWAESTVGVYDTATGAVLRVVQSVPTWWTVNLALSPEGSLLATRGAKGFLEVHETTGDKPPRRFGPVSYVPLSLAFSPDGRTLAVALGSGMVELFDLIDGGQPDILHGHKGRALDVAFSPDGSLVATASEDQTIRLWDARTARPVLVLEPRQGRQIAVAFSPDGDRLATSTDTSLSLWRIMGHRERIDLSENIGGTCLAFHPHKPVVAAGAGTDVVLSNLERGGHGQRWTVWGEISGQLQGIECVAIDPGGTLMARQTPHRRAGRRLRAVLG